VGGYPRTKLTLKAEELGSELLVYDEERRLYHLLNPTARLVWQLCDGVHDADGIAREVARHYPSVDPGRIRDDVERTLRTFSENGLIVLAAEPAGAD